MRILFLAIFSACLAGALSREARQYEGYAFVYFKGNTIEGEKIYLAASKGNDALNWIELNGGKPILASKYGTRGLRDPFLMRSHSGDTFYLMATDLSKGSGTSWGDATHTGSRYLEIWESKDLINWSEQRHVLVSPPTAGMTWAPKAIYDESRGKYLVFWSSLLYDENDTGHKKNGHPIMFYAVTEDFVAFGEPKVWQDTGYLRIDAMVLKEDNVYYRFTKDEAAVYCGRKDIIQESSKNLTAPVENWKRMTDCIGKIVGTGEIEGPTSFKSNPGDVNGEKYYLFVDEYDRRGYVALETDDIEFPAWKMSKSYKLPTGSRHGAVIPITAEELARITSVNETDTPSAAE